MKNATAAAAAASISTIRGGVYLDSYDARIIEFQYSIWKIGLLTTHIKAMLIKVRNFPNLIPLIHYIETLTGPLLNLSQGLTKKLESIASLKTLNDNNKKLVLPLSISELNFQLRDTDHVKADYTNPSVDYKQLLLDLLSVLENAQTMYQKKLDQVTLERDAHRIPSPNTVSAPFDNLAVKDLLVPSEITSLFKYVIQESEIETYQFQKSILFIEAIQRALGDLKKFERSLSAYKAKPNDGTVKKLPFWSFTNHRIFAVYIRLADFYTILRKFGCELYLPVASKLESSQLVQQQQNNLEVALRQCSVYFKNERHNDGILAKLAEATQKGAIYQLSHTTISDFSQGLQFNLGLITKLIVALSEFVKGWEAIRNVEIPTAKSRARSSSLTTPVKTPMSKVDTLNGTSGVVATEKRTPIAFKEPSLKKPEPKQQSPILSRSGSLRVNRSRSGSNASMHSNSSASSSSQRSNSLQGSKPNASPTVSRSPSINRRPASVYISSPAFDIRTQLRRQERAKASEALAARGSSSNDSPGSSKSQSPSAQITTRRRSSSLQNPQSLSCNERNNTLLASAAGATALRNERHSSLKENSEANRKSIMERQNFLRVNHPSTAARSRSPSPLRSKTNTDLPNIAEITLVNSVHSTPTKRKSRTLPTNQPIEATHVQSHESPKGVTVPSVLPSPIPSKPKEAQVAPILKKDSPPVEDEEEEEDCPVPEPLPVVLSPSVKPLQKEDDDDDVPELSPSDTPELVEINSESPVASEPRSTPDSKSLKSEETLEDLTEPRKLIKKVRFTGVPPLGPELKPKRRGWVNPPKDLSLHKQPFAPAAAASMQSERMTFQRANDREDGSFLSSVVKSAPRTSKGSKWRSLKDRFT